MTKRLDPEIKSVRALDRALTPLDHAARMRTLEWLVARELRCGGWTLPRLPELQDSATAEATQEAPAKEARMSPEREMSAAEARLAAKPRNPAYDLVLQELRLLRSQLEQAEQREKGLREFAADLDANGLRCDLTPTMNLGSVSDLYESFAGYLRRIDGGIRLRAHSVLAAQSKESENSRA